MNATSIIVNSSWQGSIQRRSVVSGALNSMRKSCLWNELLGVQNSISSVTVSQKEYRRFSSHQRNSNFKLDGLAFSIAPEKALVKFENWARQEQGLNYLLSWSSVRIAAAYAPLWSFDVNLRFKLEGNNSNRAANSNNLWVPTMFAQAYPNQATIFVPGLSVYSGHSYQRSLINPLHTTTLVFLADQVQPFGNWMLRDMKFTQSNQILQVFPDPWNTTKAQSQELLRHDLTVIAQSENPKAQLQMQVVSARRVYLPVYIVEYKILGMEYQAFLSGCDDGVGVSGVNHQLFGNKSSNSSLSWWSFSSPESIFQGASSAAQMGSRILGPRGLATFFAVVLQFVGSITARILMRLPAVAFMGSIVVGFRKILFPWLNHRYASAQWERQRDRETAAAAASTGDHILHSDDFDDVLGSARRYFEANKAQILRTLAGENDHHRGDYDWYKEWEEWARRQYDQQTYQQGGYYQQEQQQQQQQQSQRKKQRATPKTDYKWDFDPNDPYSVLGIRRGATKAEVSAAFRREMLKHHPDTQVNATEAAKARAQERSKYITEAYRRIKTEMR